MSETQFPGTTNEIEPEDIARILIERVTNYCNNQRDALACLKENSPNMLNILLTKYLTDDERKIFIKLIWNSNKPMNRILTDMKEKYEVRWKFEILDRIADFLSNELNLVLNSIIKNNELDHTSKLKRLKFYETLLDEFGNTIEQALGGKKPLDKKELYNWIAKFLDIAFIINMKDLDKVLYYYKELEYYLGYYEILDDREKLILLEVLMNDIGKTLFEAWVKREELEASNSKG